MTVNEALASRRSVRDFLPTPVSGDVIRRVLEAAARAPSGGNVQPWHIDVVAGARLDELKAVMQRRLQEVAAGDRSEQPEYDIYPKELWAPYRDYRFQLGEAMYAALGIPREDKLRAAAMVRAQLPVLRCAAGAVLLDRPAHGAAAMVRPGHVPAVGDAAAARGRPGQLRAGMLVGVPEDRRPTSSASRPSACCSAAWPSAMPTRRIRSTSSTVERAPLAQFARFHGI